MVTLTKNDVFVEKGYADQDVFVLNVFKTINENESSSCVDLDYSLGVWHGRLGYVNIGYTKKMTETGIITSLSETNGDICEICANTKKRKPLNNSQEKLDLGTPYKKTVSNPLRT